MLMRSPNGKQRPFKHLHPMPNMPLPKCLALGRGHSYSEHLLPSQWLKEIIPASQYCFILFLRIKLSFLFMHSFIWLCEIFVVVGGLQSTWALQFARQIQVPCGMRGSSSLTREGGFLTTVLLGKSLSVDLHITQINPHESLKAVLIIYYHTIDVPRMAAKRKKRKKRRDN